MQHKAVIGFENIIENKILDTQKIVEHILKTLWYLFSFFLVKMFV